jgi:hypothetical protein
MASDIAEANYPTALDKPFLYRRDHHWEALRTFEVD